MDIHEKNTRKCKFFLSREICPFSDNGCKFVHDKHEPDETQTIEDEYSINENQCHLCRLQLTTKDDLMDHVEADHEDYFQGVLEYAAAHRT